MLTILNELSEHHNPATNTFDLDAFKRICITPMKSLIQEMVGNFSEPLMIFSVKVGELTDDKAANSNHRHPSGQMGCYRKHPDTSYTNLLSLVTIAKIHLLHNERGPMLESIITRTIRRTEQTKEYARLVGLSATLKFPEHRILPARGREERVFLF